MRVCKALVCGRGSLARQSGRDGYVTGEFGFLFVAPPPQRAVDALLEHALNHGGVGAVVGEVFAGGGSRHESMVAQAS